MYFLADIPLPVSLPGPEPRLRRFPFLSGHEVGAVPVFSTSTFRCGASIVLLEAASLTTVAVGWSSSVWVVTTVELDFLLPDFRKPNRELFLVFGALVGGLDSDVTALVVVADSNDDEEEDEIFGAFSLERWLSSVRITSSDAAGKKNHFDKTAQ